MKGHKTFIIVFCAVFVLYVVVELNKPKPIDWSITLSKNDKIPYGGAAIYDLLKDIFPRALISSYRTPLYDQLNNSDTNNTAYVIISPAFNPSAADVEELKAYVRKGNDAFVSSNSFSDSFLDSFKLKTDTRYSLKKEDSTSINFVNPSLKAEKNYTFFKTTIDQYFSKVDTKKTTILGIDNRYHPNYIKVAVGRGALFVHADPVCFSNYFILYKDNASYAAKALSYISPNVGRIYWDEYYKAGREGAATPFRFLLSNEYLRWAFRLAIIGVLLYVLFQMKRRQRIIPVNEPLRNTTLDFVKTVSSVYFNERDNSSLAEKKTGYFLDFVRQRFSLSTSDLNPTFVDQLSRKSGVEKEYVAELVNLVVDVQNGQKLSDDLLVTFNNRIDNFYKMV